LVGLNQKKATLMPQQILLFDYNPLEFHLNCQSGFQGNQHPFLTHIGDKPGMAGYQAVIFCLGNLHRVKKRSGLSATEQATQLSFSDLKQQS
jgi:hypothetical protein